MTKLESLFLSSNELTGQIPRELGNIFNLLFLGMRDNRLTGCIPEELLAHIHDFADIDLPFCDAPAGGHLAAERAVLTSLYYATGGPNWVDNKNWLSDAPVGEWSGVVTDDRMRVVSLRLWGNRLTGPIPPELSNLNRLRGLSLGRNQLTGAIPSQLGGLAGLRLLDVGENLLSGSIPHELGNLTRMHSLELNSNRLTGAIPSELSGMASLKILDLKDNQLSGSIPQELGEQMHLYYFELVGNQLTGCLPASLQEVVVNDFEELGLSFCGPGE